jgi:pilus assembly protein CpaF
VLVSPGDLAVLVERIVGPLGLRVDRTSPMVDARLTDGSRVNIVVPPLALDGTCITIRRFRSRAVPLGAFTPDPALEEALLAAVRQRLTILVVGGTGAGKTTLLNALAAAIPSGERLITVEDTAELRLPGDHVVRLEARPANADGVGEVTIRQLVRNALRMRPDRLLVGEVRGGEAFDLVQALNTGHEGSLSTCHANGTTHGLRRLESLVLLAGVELPLAAVRDLIEAAVDLVVHVGRDGTSRRIIEVAEVAMAGGRPEGRALWPSWADPERPRVAAVWGRGAR